MTDDPGPATDGSATDGAGFAPKEESRSRLGSLAELASVTRFGQFASVGVVGAVFDNVVLTVAKLGLGAPTMVAKVAGIETAVLVMFALNERWTFSEAGRPGTRAFLRRLGRSHLVRSGGVAVQLVVYWALTQRLSVELVAFGTDLWFLAASPVAIGVAMVVNYVAESVFTWRVHR